MPYKGEYNTRGWGVLPSSAWVRGLELQLGFIEWTGEWVHGAISKEKVLTYSSSVLSTRSLIGYVWRRSQHCFPNFSVSLELDCCTGFHHHLLLRTWTMSWDWGVMVFLTAKGSIYSIISNAEGGERGLVPYKQLGLISTICLSYRRNEGWFLFLQVRAWWSIFFIQYLKGKRKESSSKGKQGILRSIF